jgi:hypothetical protein
MFPAIIDCGRSIGSSTLKGSGEIWRRFERNRSTPDYAPQQVTGTGLGRTHLFYCWQRGRCHGTAKLPDFVACAAAILGIESGDD